MESDPYRLPDNVVPSDYQLTIVPDFENETFCGRVRIEAVVTEATDNVMLNNDGLAIRSAVLQVPGQEPANCEVVLDPEHERMELQAPTTLQPGEISIDVEFEGEFDEQLVGLYLSEYVDDDGTKHKIAATQFQSTFARKCFPCMDEPSFKARFAISLEVSEEYLAVANGPELGRTPLGDGKIRIDFAPTMPMSSYLVAFVVGPLEATESIDVDGVPLRVVHRIGKANLANFALEAGAAGLRYFTDYFGLPYPDQKIDLVALPDFAFGAMENLGCITFRETALLTDPDRATKSELQRVADVINHELAHMWFGDLVTMKWWNGLWLNEAFATFMEMRATDAFRPEWQRWTDFALSRAEAFATDTLTTTRPIEFEVVKPADADAMFDILTYEKGAAVVRMLEQYIGEDRFRDGIRSYMLQHQFGNAETTDLWDALEETTGEPIRRIMDSWIFQGGYPLVTVEANADGATLRQERMRFSGAGVSEDQTWSVPLRYRWQPAGGGEPQEGRVLLEGDEPAELNVGGERPEWLVVNATASGFLRTAYDGETRSELADIANEVLSPVERFALVDDTWSAVLAGEVSTPSFLNLLESLTAETDRSVWVRMLSGFKSLKRLVDGEAEVRMEEIVHDAISPTLAYLGLAPEGEESDERGQLRGDLVRGLGIVANDGDLQEEAKRTVAVARRNPELVDPTVAAAAVDVVASVGDEADFEDFMSAWKSATTPQEELRFLGALFDFPRADLIARLHEMILDGEIRPQNSPLLVRRAFGNPHAVTSTWAFVVEHWDDLVKLFPASLVPRMLEGLVFLDTPELADSTAAFFADRPIPSGEQRVHQALEHQRVQVALRQREASRLRQFLAG